MIHVDVAKLLIEHGAELDQLSEETAGPDPHSYDEEPDIISTYTALACACGKRTPCMGMIALLRSKGARDVECMTRTESSSRVATTYSLEFKKFLRSLPSDSWERQVDSET